MDARGLLDELNLIIAAIRRCSRDVPEELPPKIRQLPKVATELRKHIRRRKGKRFPAWECVKAVDSRWPEIGLMSALEEMFQKAIVQEPLKQLRDAVVGNDEDLKLFESLERHLDERPDDLPPNLCQYTKILERQSPLAITNLAKMGNGQLAIVGLVVGAHSGIDDDAVAHAKEFPRRKSW